MFCGSLSGATARRHGQGMINLPAKRDNHALAPDRPRPEGPLDEPTGFVASP
ncbi:MAG: hypothetical protein PsegKO_19200 [Pseudohongiellaceae bacterium]